MARQQPHTWRPGTTTASTPALPHETLLTFAYTTTTPISPHIPIGRNLFDISLARRPSQSPRRKRSTATEGSPPTTSPFSSSPDLDDSLAHAQTNQTTANVTNESSPKVAAHGAVARAGGAGRNMPPRRRPPTRIDTRQDSHPSPSNSPTITHRRPRPDRPGTSLSTASSSTASTLLAPHLASSLANPTQRQSPQRRLQSDTTTPQHPVPPPGALIQPDPCPEPTTQPHPQRTDQEDVVFRSHPAPTPNPHNPRSSFVHLIPPLLPMHPDNGFEDDIGDDDDDDIEARAREAKEVDKRLAAACREFWTGRNGRGSSGRGGRGRRPGTIDDEDEFLRVGEEVMVRLREEVGERIQGERWRFEGGEIEAV
ncbi:hypothetical protein CAC42_637 [Sphaceloma murrayae]|uniref:Uncharacterized protein n=1 Tax=Sphaceloma murrayae TaxID=2082308 RepID=A0A2K1QJN8_9PEZI|nr:hypothetical protein CAC42_637 [Sphaceloma murrayae]